MRITAAAVVMSSAVLALGSLGALAGPTAAAARPTAQSAHCAQEAKRQHLSGRRRAAFIKTCLKGPLETAKPTGLAEPNKESQAITKPSGVDRNVRADQCNAEAARKKLSGQARRQYLLSCLATAGPVSEGETGVTEPHPANSINGIGVNNYKRSRTTAKSTPAPPR